MDDKQKDFSTRILKSLEELTIRVQRLESEVAMLKGEAPASQFTDNEPIDLSLGTDIDVAGYNEPAEESASEDIAPVQDEAVIMREESVYEEADANNEPVPVENIQTEAEELPEVLEAAEMAPKEELPYEKSDARAEDLPDDDGFAGLFGEETFVGKAEKPAKHHRIEENEVYAKKGKAILDVMADKLAWYRDMPGPEVKSLRSAIGLGEQVVFIRHLFRDDSALYQSSIEKLNMMKSLDEAVAYLRNTFPEWNMESDDVYRFMMAVRRKIR